MFISYGIVRKIVRYCNVYQCNNIKYMYDIASYDTLKYIYHIIQYKTVIYDT